ncbi:N-acetyltransferase [Hydrogenimonas cancrithermarum]|uniref:Acetyltransferase n=1 Tax=Hydrogenimonas cancrithermarum TaxID=2993563 RepID=A0ABM8FNJ0_9BACT|nr:acetyltransferase [Hydrogenimonas cancrithermarum]
MPVKFEKPILPDIPEMQAIVKKEVEEGVILPRSDDELATNIRSYTVAKEAETGEIIGYVALHIHSMRLGEIRSLIVKEGHRHRKVGSRLVELAVEEGRKLRLQEVLALTYMGSFFERLGFSEIPKETIPEHKIWADCIKCKYFPVCNEISLIKKL